MNSDITTLVETAKNYAISCHRKVNHWYDGRRYEYHLDMVYNDAKRYLYLLPEELHPYVLAASYCHDVFEDCRESYNDIKKNVGEIVADIVYAVSQEKGKNRDERQNDKYYNGIKMTTGATYVKICDRLANTKYSKMSGSSMFYKYKKEYPHFKHNLYVESYKDMFIELDEINEVN